jgi:ABC-type transport system involved in cytochrome c biogenesis permease subunit
MDRKRIELYEQARLFQAIAQGSLPGFIPHPEDPRAGWFPLEGLAAPETRVLLQTLYPASELNQFQKALSELVQASRGEDSSFLFAAAEQFAVSIKRLLESREIELDQGKIQTELVYHRLRPFQWAWMLYLASALLWFFLRDRQALIPLGFFLTGFALHTFGFVLRCTIAARPPVTNMYESVIWVAWAVALFSVALAVVNRKSIFLLAASWVSFLTLLIGESFPAVLDPSLSPLVPVLRNNYWLTVHVLTITLSYGAFLLAWGLGHANLMSFAFRPEKKEEHERLAEYLYRALQIGVVLLAAGTILGGVWANDSWGRFWGWDPKETWALTALFGYLAVLHGRFSGWLGPFGTALGSVIAFLGILMAWYGVNFVLAAGFHSYGFSGGGLPYVLLGVLADSLFISFLAFRYNKNLRSGSFTRR